MPPDRRLPGRRHALSSGFPEELWLRGDHLLCVRQAVFVESYQRFYYRDIESITVTATRRFLLLNLLFGVILVMGAVLLLLDVPFPVFCVFAGLWLFLTLINLAFGATCKTMLRTRVNTRSLTSLRRMRTTRKALALLSERIRAAQAEEETPDAGPPSTNDERQMTNDNPEPPPLPAAAPPPLPPAGTVVLRWHQALAVLLALQALAALNAALYPRFGLAALLVSLLFIATAVSVPALITQRRRDAPRPARAACWWASGFQFLVGYVVLTGLGILTGARPQLSFNLSPLIEAYETLLAAHGALRSVFVVHAGFAFCLAAWLAAALRSARRP
jgi:hypothetical protein